MNSLNSIPGGPLGAAATVQHTLDAASSARKAEELHKHGNKDEAARELEKLFVSLLVKEMRKSLPEGFFAQGPGSNVYAGFFDQMMSEALASGPGTGLRQSILESWHDAPSADRGESDKGVSENTTP